MYISECRALYLWHICSGVSPSCTALVSVAVPYSSVPAIRPVRTIYKIHTQAFAQEVITVVGDVKVLEGSLLQASQSHNLENRYKNIVLEIHTYHRHRESSTRDVLTTDIERVVLDI